MKCKKMICINGVEADNEIYCVSSEMNILYLLDKNTRTVSIVGSAPGEPLFGKYLFGNIVCLRDKLYLIPLYADKIHVYDMKSNTWHDIELPLEIKKVQGKFFGAAPLQDRIYLLGYYYKGIAVLEVETENIVTINLENEVRTNNIDKYGFLNWDYVIKDNYLITPILCKNSVLKISLDNNHIDEIIVGPDDCKYVGIVFDGTDYWLPPRVGKKVIRWDGHNSVSEFVLPDDYTENEFYFGGSFYSSNRVYFTSYTGYTYIFEPNEFEKGEVFREDIQFYIKCQDGVIMQNSKGDCFSVGNGIRPWNYLYEEMVFNEFIRFKYDNQYSKLIIENEVFNLENLLDITTM